MGRNQFPQKIAIGRRRPTRKLKRHARLSMVLFGLVLVAVPITYGYWTVNGLYRNPLEIGTTYTLTQARRTYKEEKPLTRLTVVTLAVFFVGHRTATLPHLPLNATARAFTSYGDYQMTRRRHPRIKTCTISLVRVKKTMNRKKNRKKNKRI